MTQAVTSSAGMVYRINDDDELVFVGAGWDQYAVANAGDAVTAAQVLHRPLWDFITDPTTLELYRQFLERTRSGRSVRLTAVRCS